MIRQGETPVIGNLRREALVCLVADLADEVIVESELVVGGDDQVGVNIPHLKRQRGTRELDNSKISRHEQYVRSERADQDSDRHSHNTSPQPNYLHSAH